MLAHAILLILGSASTSASAATCFQSDTPESEASSDHLVATIPEGFAAAHMAEQIDKPAELEYLPFTFSPDGTRVAFYAAKKDRIYAFLDGDDIGYGHKGLKPVYSENGEHVLMATAKVNKNRSEKWSVYVDGKSVAKEDWVGPAVMADDGNSFAYWTKPDYRLDPSGKPILNRACLVFGHRSGKRFRRKTSEIYPWALTYRAPGISEDGTRAIGAAHDDTARGVLISVGGSEDEVLHRDRGYIRQTAYSKDRKHHAFVRNVIKKQIKGYERPETVTYPRLRIEVNGDVVKVNADTAALPEFSSSGGHYAFVYVRDKQFGIGMNGYLVEPSENMIFAARPDSTGTRMAWIEHRDGELLEDQWLSPYSSYSVYQGKAHMCSAYAVKEDGGLTLEEVEFSDPWDRIHSFEYSPNEDYVAFIAQEGLEDLYVVCGSQKIGPFREIDRIRWVDEHTVAAGVREHHAFWWRTLTVEG
jgi:hypothetical protein